MATVKKKEKIPKAPFSHIAISLSGGGYRASAFHLGVLTYLSSKKFLDVTLLERTRIMSTVSAGTFVGVKYATSIKTGKNIESCYKSLYGFMSQCDLVAKALNYLSEDKNWQHGRKRTLINAFSSIYEREFESEKFGLLWNEANPIHLKELIFNATEFNFGMPFRFQKSERSNIISENFSDEFIGNKKIHIPVDVAKEIKFSDIIAASSCFPFGFEPINFPDDFIYEGAVKLKDNSSFPSQVYDGEKINYPIGLMDGSIDDNQGVDGVINAEDRLKHYPKELQSFCSEDEKAIDLYIISDASSPKITNYKKNDTDHLGIVGRWNFESLKYFGISSFIAGLTAVMFAIALPNKLIAIGLSIFGTWGFFIACILLIFSLGLRFLTRKLGVPEYVVKRLLHFDKLKLGTLYQLLVNRRKSSMTLISDVFIKHMRWLSYERIYGDIAWRPRLVMNAVFEFTEEEVEKRKRKYPEMSEEILNPGKKIIDATTRANMMSTKLWFTPEELKGDENTLDTLIACGQFTICFSLLEYIEKYIKNNKFQTQYDKYDEGTKLAINQLEFALLEDWRKFKQDPYWMVKVWNEK